MKKKGRPQIKINWGRVGYLKKEGKSNYAIAEKLNIAQSTLHTKLREYVEEELKKIDEADLLIYGSESILFCISPEFKKHLKREVDRITYNLESPRHATNLLREEIVTLHCNLLQKERKEAKTPNKAYRWLSKKRYRRKKQFNSSNKHTQTENRKPAFYKVIFRKIFKKNTRINHNPSPVLEKPTIKTDSEYISNHIHEYTNTFSPKTKEVK
tara:strand:- start:381 stop:1016 length:636 start_codon:yes stop_codon:yes gene_type:complete